MDLEEQLKQLRALRKSLLEKRSKNVREKTSNITEAQAQARRKQYARSIGLEPKNVSGASKPKDLRGTGNALNYGGQFDLAHEMGHAMQTAPGKTVSAHMRGIGPDDKEDDDTINTALEHRIDRRAGVDPHKHAGEWRGMVEDINEDGEPSPREWNADISSGHTDDYEAKEALSNQADRASYANKTIGQFDQGHRFNDKGKLLAPGGIDARINQRAVGVKPGKFGRKEPRVQLPRQLSMPFAESPAPNTLKSETPVDRIIAALRKNAESGALRLSRTELEHHLANSGLTFMTAENPAAQQLDPAQNATRNRTFEKDLARLGARFHRVKGRYGGNEENSYMIFHGGSATPAALEKLGAKYGQESVLHSIRGNHQLKYVSGPNAGKHHPGEGYTMSNEAPDFYSRARGIPQKFTANINFGETVDKSEHQGGHHFTIETDEGPIGVHFKHGEMVDGALVKNDEPGEKQSSQWRSRPILKEEHARDLDHAAAAHALSSGSASEGERMAYAEYTRGHSLDAAAHHYHQAAAAQKRGNRDLAERHLLKYGEYARKLGMDPMGNPGPEVGQRIRQLSQKKGPGFRAHPGDKL